MSLQKDQLSGTQWMARIQSANEYFKKWEKRFKCKELNNYYEGQQWKADPDLEAYCFNLFFSTVDLKIPSLIFQNPQFFLTPKPSKSDFNPDQAFETSLLASDTLNSVIAQDNVNFVENLEMSILDSFTYFGMVEVGYDASWVDNPNAGKPVIESDYDPNAKSESIVKEPEKIPESEWIYVKRIPAHRFRVGTNDTFNLEQANWVGYYEYMRLQDIKDPKSGFKNVGDLQPEAGNTDQFLPEMETEEPTQFGDFVKVWKAWDLRSKIRYIIAELNGTTVIHEKPFKRLPLFGLKFGHRRRGWYPIPVTYNWKSPQDEMNESKEQLRTHRRRSRRVFQVMEGAASTEELEKLVNAKDGSYIITAKENAVVPIDNPTADSSVMNSMQISRDDFDNISATTQQERGQSNRTTATEIQAINSRASIRETKESEVVAKWECDIAREVMLQVIEKFTMPVWVKMNVDSNGGDAWGGEYQGIQEKWKQIQTDYFEGFDFNVNIQVSSMSPLANEKEMQNYIRFVTFLQQFPMVSLNPSLIRETAFRLGYRNEKVIKQFMEMAQLAMIGQLEQAQQQVQGLIAGKGGIGGSMAQKTEAQMQPPDQEQINNQIAAGQDPEGQMGQ